MIKSIQSTPLSNALITANRYRLAELIAKGLQRENWKTVIATDHNEILQLLHCNHFQMLILDLDRFDEIKFVLLTQLQQSCTIPVLLLTSYEEYGDRANQQFENVLDVFIKPFRIQDIIQFGKRLQVASEQT